MSELTLESFELALASEDCRPTRNGNRIQAYCPICSGKSKSKELSITTGEKTPIVANCFSCGNKVAGRPYYLALVDTLGFSFKGNSAQEQKPPSKGRATTNANKKEEPNQASRKLPPEAIEAVYPYRDSKGNEWNKVRLVEGYRDGGKFRIAEQLPDGTWKLSTKPKGAGPHLYRLQELDDSLAPVWLCEGERDCDNLWALGIPAVSVPDGAKSWRVEHSELVRGRSIMIAGDNDDAGQEMIAIASVDLLSKCRNVRSVKWTDGAPKGYDISDHIEAGANRAEFERMWAKGRKHGNFTLADLHREIGDIQWAWHQRIAQGQGLGIIALQAAGKTLLALWLANHFVTGNDWPDGSPFTGRRGRILLVETESKIATHFETLRDWGISLDNITMPEFEPGDMFATPNLHSVDHLGIIERELDAGHTGVMVVDSINGGILGDENDARRQSITRHLVQLGQKYKVTVFIVGHVVKGLKDGEPPKLHHVRGTSGLTQSLSNIQGLWNPDLYDVAYRGLIPVKYSYKQWPGNLGFTMTEDGLDMWGAMRVADDKDQDKSAKMIQYIMAYLQNNSGRALASDIKRDIAATFGLKPNTVESYLSRHWRHIVISEKDEIDDQYYWRLRGLIPSDHS